MKEKCPCEICIVRPLCRQQYFSDFKYCNEVSFYLGFFGRELPEPADRKKHFKNYPKFYKTLRPTKWTFKKWPIGHDRRKIDYQVNQLKKPRL